MITWVKGEWRRDGVGHDWYCGTAADLNGGEHTIQVGSQVDGHDCGFSAHDAVIDWEQAFKWTRGTSRGPHEGLLIRRDRPRTIQTSAGPITLVTTQPGYNAVADLYQGRMPTAPGKKVVEDWPIRCPKCGRDKAAVLLFSDYDCRFGCYARKVGVQ